MDFSIRRDNKIDFYTWIIHEPHQFVSTMNRMYGSDVFWITTAMSKSFNHFEYSIIKKRVSKIDRRETPCDQTETPTSR